MGGFGWQFKEYMFERLLLLVLSFTCNSAASSVRMLNLYGGLVFWSDGCLMICRVCLSIASELLEAFDLVLIVYTTVKENQVSQMV